MTGRYSEALNDPRLRRIEPMAPRKGMSEFQRQWFLKAERREHELQLLRERAEEDKRQQKIIDDLRMAMEKKKNAR